MNPTSRFPPQQAANSNTVGKAAQKQGNSPFNKDWLIKNFDIDPSDIKETKFCSVGVMYEVHFQPGKEHIALMFYDNLIRHGCHPRYFAGHTVVELNKFQEEKIVKAGTLILQNQCHVRQN